MNQIIFTGDKGKKIEINKVVIAFSIIIIIFAIFLIGIGINSLNKNKQGNDKNINTSVPEIITNAEGNSVELKIKNEVAIEKVYYSWKNGEENEIENISGQNEVTQTVLLPNEDTTLNIRVIDIYKQEHSFSKDFKYNSNADVVKPTIKFDSNITGYVTVTVTDNREISYVEYNWNEDEASRIKANENQKTKMELRIPAREGENTLTILAVDASGNSSLEDQIVRGYKKPKIELKKNRGEIIIIATDEEEITKVVYEINGMIYEKFNTGENKKVFEIRDLLVKGKNIIKVTAYNKAGETAEKTGQCTY